MTYSLQVHMMCRFIERTKVKLADTLVLAMLNYNSDFLPRWIGDTCLFCHDRHLFISLFATLVATAFKLTIRTLNNSPDTCRMAATIFSAATEPVMITRDR